MKNLFSARAPGKSPAPPAVDVLSRVASLDRDVTLP
jgi:hypothetical protein